MKRMILLAASVCLLSYSSAWAQTSEQAIARCYMEFLKHPDALRRKEEEFYQTCMKAQGFDFNPARRTARVLISEVAPECYERPKPPGLVERATDWLNSFLRR